jgi:hypothetical protein
MKGQQDLNISYQKAPVTKNHSFLFFILFPAIAMLLGWGLRGFIGGGTYGAMIPGAMVMITICMLLDAPLKFAAVAIVFGTVGIAMGGEMTYGQTLGFLRNPDTIWWGLAGTSLKGGVWGLTGGLFIALGLLYPRIKIKTILVGFLIFLIAFVIGLKLINDPKVLYFSDPFNHPRDESWAGILFAVIGFLIFLKIKIAAEEFKVVKRFTLYGLLGGVLGFGLGSLWITVGAQYGDRFLIIDWWKMMEFSFGLILGGFLGFAAWRHHNSSQPFYQKKPSKTSTTKISTLFSLELISILLIGLFVYATMSFIEIYVDIIRNSKGILIESLATIGRVFVSYMFIGLLLITIVLYWPFLAFQIAVTLTFCNCVIDLVDDKKLFPALQSLPLFYFGIIVVASLIVAAVVAVFQRKRFVLRSMLLILVWSTMTVAIIRLFVSGGFNFRKDHSLTQIIMGDLFVFNVFIISAIIVSVMVIKNKIFKSQITTEQKTYLHR